MYPWKYFVLPTKRNSLNPNKVDSASSLMIIIVSIMKDEASLIQIEKARNSIKLIGRIRTET